MWSTSVSSSFLTLNYLVDGGTKPGLCGGGKVVIEVIEADFLWKEAPSGEALGFII